MLLWMDIEKVSLRENAMGQHKADLNDNCRAGGHPPKASSSLLGHQRMMHLFCQSKFSLSSNAWIRAIPCSMRARDMNVWVFPFLPFWAKLAIPGDRCSDAEGEETMGARSPGSNPGLRGALEVLQDEITFK